MRAHLSFVLCVRQVSIFELGFRGLRLFFVLCTCVLVCRCLEQKIFFVGCEAQSVPCRTSSEVKLTQTQGPSTMELEEKQASGGVRRS